MLTNTGDRDNNQIGIANEGLEVKVRPSQTIKYSYNPLITSDLTKEEGGMKTRGWSFTEIPWNESELINMITTQSYIPSELKDGHKIMSNVKGVHSIVLDFDKGTPSLQEFMELASRYPFSWVAHTTVNHQKNKLDKLTGNPISGSAIDKFRVIFPLSEPITASAYEACQSFWCQKFPNIDTTSFQGNRYYKVNPNAEVYFHNSYIGKDGELFDAPFINPYNENMISDSFKKKPKGRPQSSGVSAGKADGSFSIDDLVHLEDGGTIKYRDIEAKTKVLCPFCDPANRQHPDKHNAFLDFNNAGQIYLYCSSENKTYWSHSSEIVTAKSSLFFNETFGYASRVIDDEKGSRYEVFKNESDWLNFCHHNSINPACKIFLPRVRIIFDPAKPSGLQKEYFNMFQESDYLKSRDISQTLLTGDEVIALMQQTSPVIHEVMMNVIGEKEYLKRFLNWNAVILKDRTKLDTAWLITSIEEGIGKGLMFDRILQPIYGKRQSILVPGERMARNFNAQDQTIWLKVFDEVHAPGNEKENKARKEWLKYIITAREQTIELKGIDAFQMSNHMNLILYSNNECPIFMGNKDRRFSVVRNEKAVKTSELSFYKNIPDMRERIDTELEGFADLLLRYDCDVELANTAIESSAKDKLQEITADEYEEFAKALKDRNTSYFLLSEIFPTTESNRELTPSNSLSPEGQEIDFAIKEGYIPSRHMKDICTYHFSEHYRKVVARLRSKSLTSMTRKVNGTPMDVYTVK